MIHCHYRSYQLTFPSKPNIMNVFGRLSLSMIKKISNKLGFSMMAQMHHAFTEKGFYAKIPERGTVCDITIDRQTGLETIREMNGSISKYQMAATYDKHISNQYHSYGSKSELTFSYVMNKLPEGVSAEKMLTEIEESSRKDKKNTMERSCYSDGYIYEGIPTEVILLTWIMLMATDGESIISRSYVANIFAMDCANPRIRTLKIIAKAWGMNLKSFITAIEKDDLILGPDGLKDEAESDNSKMTILSRITDLTDYVSWHEFARSFPEERKITVRNLIHTPDSDIEIYTLLALIKPFPYIKLSDLFM